DACLRRRQLAVPLPRASRFLSLTIVWLEGWSPGGKPPGFLFVLPRKRRACSRRVAKRNAGWAICRMMTLDFATVVWATDALGSLSAVMAGLVPASRVYPTCSSLLCGSRACPTSDAIHVLNFSDRPRRRGCPRKRGHDLTAGCGA